MVADEIGVASMILGAGRATKEDVIDLAVGLVLHKKVGDKVEEGESILTIYSNRENVEDVKQKIIRQYLYRRYSYSSNINSYSYH